MPKPISEPVMPSTFSELVEISKQENWCVRPRCTTCGAINFRKALQKISREKIISGLRSLSEDFLANNKDLFCLTIEEISIFGVGGELLEPLKGTPAASELRSNIDFQNRIEEKRRAYAASQTPEAIASLREKKKAEAILQTAPHRERKLASLEIIRAAAQELEKLSPDKILTIIAENNFGISPQALGGLVYKRLAEHYKHETIHNNDLNTLSFLATNYAGYWKKLLERINRLPRNHIS